MLNRLDDEQLMQLIGQADHSAFAVLLARHTQRFLQLAAHTVNSQSDAEDIVQNAFIKLWQRPSAWDSQKSRFTTWFYRVIINACYDHYRSRKPFSEVSEPAFERALGFESGEQSKLEEQQYEQWRQECLEVSIAKLPASQRDAINLVVYNAVPQKQAAKIMGIGLKALESLLVRAKRNMTKSVNELSTQIQEGRELESEI